jgi:hypothetical protein
MIGIGVALWQGRRSGAAMRAIGRELRPEVLPPPFLHFGQDLPRVQLSFPEIALNQLHFFFDVQPGAAKDILDFIFS